MQSLPKYDPTVVLEKRDNRGQVFFTNITKPITTFVTEKYEVSNPMMVRLSWPPDKPLDAPIRPLAINEPIIVEEQRQGMGRQGRS